MWLSLKGNKNNRHWETLVDYTIEDLKKHIELQFTKNMSWNKYLCGDLSIDHILPVELFEYEIVEESLFKICWSLNNLRPMWKNENIIKSDLLPDGRRARTLTKQEKIDYLKELGLL